MFNLFQIVFLTFGTKVIAEEEDEEAKAFRPRHEIRREVTPAECMRQLTDNDDIINNINNIHDNTTIINNNNIEPSASSSSKPQEVNLQNLAATKPVQIHDQNGSAVTAPNIICNMPQNMPQNIDDILSSFINNDGQNHDDYHVGFLFLRPIRTDLVGATRMQIKIPNNLLNATDGQYSKWHGNLGETGFVLYVFDEKKGVPEDFEVVFYATEGETTCEVGSASVGFKQFVEKGEQK